MMYPPPPYQYPGVKARWWPGYGPGPSPWQEGVRIEAVENGWIVTAVIREPRDPDLDAQNDEDDDYEPYPYDFRQERRVFQFEQKDAMLGYVAEVTPADSGPRS